MRGKEGGWRVCPVVAVFPLLNYLRAFPFRPPSRP